VSTSASGPWWSISGTTAASSASLPVSQWPAWGWAWPPATWSRARTEAEPEPAAESPIEWLRRELRDITDTAFP
jgi:hypothetical protein